MVLIVYNIIQERFELTVILQYCLNVLQKSIIQVLVFYLCPILKGNHKNRSEIAFTHKDNLMKNGIYYSPQQYNINDI